MGNQQSKLMCMFGGEYIASTIIYHVIFWKLFTHFQKVKNKPPKDCLNIATNTISTINSIISCLAFYDFFVYQRWKKPTIDDPLLAGHIWAFGSGYFTADLIAHIVCFMAYNSKKIPRRWDVLLHHIILVNWWFIGVWPKFIYGWNVYSIFYGVEMSTIFLNLQWFGKYFENKKLENMSKKLFILTWYLVRVPIIIYCIYWFFKYWDKINNDMPLAAKIYLFVGLIFLTPLQFIWSVLIIWKAFVSNTAKPPPSLHGVSIDL
eukprot:276947_1